MLAGLDDPYNPARTAQAVARNRQLLANSPAGQVAGFTKFIISNIPYVGKIFGFLDEISDLIGNAVQSMTHGGFDDLPLLSKKRIAIYFWGTIGNQYKIIPPSNFMVFKPMRANFASIEDYKAHYEQWIRATLLVEARKQQYARMAKTDDEPMLPVDKINELFAAGLWPPPLEPLPLTFVEWRTRYPQFITNSWYVYNEPMLDSDLVDFSRQVYQQLLSEYKVDAQKFYDATRDVAFPPDLALLASKTDMMPPLGSAANPIRSTRAGTL